MRLQGYVSWTTENRLGGGNRCVPARLGGTIIVEKYKKEL
jgi:hypothetical protein